MSGAGHLQVGWYCLCPLHLIVRGTAAPAHPQWPARSRLLLLGSCSLHDAAPAGSALPPPQVRHVARAPAPGGVFRQHQSVPHGQPGADRCQRCRRRTEAGPAAPQQPVQGPLLGAAAAWRREGSALRVCAGRARRARAAGRPPLPSPERHRCEWPAQGQHAVPRRSPTAVESQLPGEAVSLGPLRACSPAVYLRTAHYPQREIACLVAATEGSTCFLLLPAAFWALPDVAPLVGGGMHGRGCPERAAACRPGKAAWWECDVQLVTASIQHTCMWHTTAENHMPCTYMPPCLPPPGRRCRSCGLRSPLGCRGCLTAWCMCGSALTGCPSAACSALCATWWSGSTRAGSRLATPSRSRRQALAPAAGRRRAPLRSSRTGRTGSCCSPPQTRWLPQWRACRSAAGRR